ncbi:MAG: lasso RiPP family leader peptide-containing protein [Acidimicrobiales bacterium]
MRKQWRSREFAVDTTQCGEATTCFRQLTIGPRTWEKTSVIAQAESTDSGGYEAPRLVMHGSVSDVTSASVVGTFTDRAFPAGTPVQDLTFSGL